MFMKSKKLLKDTKVVDLVSVDHEEISKQTPSILVSDLEIQGSLSTTGVIEVGANVVGNIKGKLITIRSEASVDGNIEADSVLIHGRIKGNIKAKNVNISSTATIEGDLYYSALNIDPGANIIGQLIRESYNQKTATDGDIEDEEIESHEEDNDYDQEEDYQDQNTK